MRLPLLTAILATAAAAQTPGAFVLPKSPAEFTQSVPYSAVESILKEADKAPHVTLTEEGKSVQGRSLWMVNLRRGSAENPWKVFLFGQQHGNEPAGKDALVWMVDDLARHPEKLPEGVDLYILPLVNPDGAEAYQRRNANNRDLNRDHITLGEPETQTLHRIAQRLLPHVSVDCHEFTRDSGDYADKGWSEWPLIMMDSANHPLFDPTVTAAGLRQVDAMRPVMEAAGFNYTRYYVGDAPPDECRHSHPELDDARNGLGAYGGLSFIIESGVYRNSSTPGSDLGQRVAAYHLLLSGFLQPNDPHREADRAAIAAARNRALPPFLPTNYFWAAKGLQVRTLKVIDNSTSATLEVSTASFFEDLIVKTVVPTPVGYAIGSEHAALFAPWFDRHGIRYTRLDAGRLVLGEVASLERLETDDDPVYKRYGGRTITKIGEPTPVQLPAGSLLVDLDQPNGVKAAIFLEPGMFYGLAQFEQFAALRTGSLPLRIVE